MNDQMTLFGPDGTEPEPATVQVRTLRVMITVKAAPNPSQTYGETVCVAAVSVDPNHPGWIRLYPVNFRYLEQDTRFSKYDIVAFEAQRARADGRHESWKTAHGHAASREGLASVGPPPPAHRAVHEHDNV